LQQVKGVGPITALAYVLTLENPQRFVKSRDVGPYLGLVPKQEDWGESQPQLGISKAGDTMVRKLLVGSSQYILGPFGPDTDLRRYGLRLCERGGKRVFITVQNPPVNSKSTGLRASITPDYEPVLTS
jgi:transposase